jgi:hypothetical protein
MKTLIILTISILSFKASACSCDFDYDESLQLKTPHSLEQTEKLIQKVFNAKIGEAESVKYYSNIFERVFYQEGNSCFYKGPNGEPQYHCRQSYKAQWEVQIPELGCSAIVKVKRNKKISTAKLVSHTCL